MSDAKSDERFASRASELSADELVSIWNGDESHYDVEGWHCDSRASVYGRNIFGEGLFRFGILEGVERVVDNPMRHVRRAEIDTGLMSEKCWIEFDCCADSYVLVVYLL